MYSDAELIDILSIKLSKKRFTHSVNVADMAKKLAEAHGYKDPNEAYTAGLVHDCCKELPTAEQLAMVKKSRRNVCEAELKTPALYHAVAGSYYAETVFDFRNEDFLNAIRYHTTGRAKMSELEEIIYMADLVSVERSFKDVEKFRKLAFADIKKAILETVKHSINEVMEKGSLIPTQTLEAYNYYTDICKKTEE
ncbi:MAG: bis(5'-nucleosyl)-tetraphosphatase (symmetrical) YqeK [Oscillospiraceae bacterium]